MYTLLRNLLFKFDPETSHTLTLQSLKHLHQLGLTNLLFKPVPGNPIQEMGLNFPNPIGLAAGLDKNGEYIDALASLGFGFIEVGTVTPRAQSGNPKPRLFRIAEREALINRMGFNNKGVDYLLQQLNKTRFQGILGINIGKNSDTPLARAEEDYLNCFRKVYTKASYVVINISSPNTLGLRELQAEKYLRHLLATLKEEQQELNLATNQYKPLVVKAAPDLDENEIESMAKILMDYHIDGLIATNTSIARGGIQDLAIAAETGGLSGRPLFKKALNVVRLFHKILGDEIPIIGVGGIMSLDDAKQMFATGAKLIQIYTGLIYQGPQLLQEISA